ncbi:MAG: anaerobic glycerol-3-phosphate dehydrogenase subunit C [Candidatus Rokuibacteriota bacterium]|nr:MAG: anaerobic glycerol-3-phosphate dehydrogenase subunit C [Candidatus Rokubacteria bacterium]
MTLDLRQADFWKLDKVDAELRRVYDICAGCRRCLPLCPPFKVLFDRIDSDAVDSDVDKLRPPDLKEVVDLCYQCKLCYNHCPYTPPHRWQVDFPRLMLRARSAEARHNRVTLQDRVLGNTDLIGKLGSLAAPVSNWMSQLAPNRKLMEAVVGIHRARQLPAFHRETFSSWFDRRKVMPSAAQTRVALFATCSVEYHDPAVGKATVAVLEKNGVDVSVPAQRCCGMPYLDGGAITQAKRLIDENVRTLAAAVREGREIIVPGPTCSYMLKQEYPWLDGSEDAEIVASHTRDLFEYLAELHAAGRLDTRFPNAPGTIAYQLPCHLKAQNLGTKSADVLRLTGARVEVVEECSRVDGTWGMKKQYFELSMKLAQSLFKGIAAAAHDHVATDCPLAALQIHQGTGRQARHPIRVLAEAYGLSVED